MSSQLFGLITFPVAVDAEVHHRVAQREHCVQIDQVVGEEEQRSASTALLAHTLRN